MKVEAASGTLIFAETLRMRYLPLSFWIILSLMLAAFTVAFHLGGGPFVVTIVMVIFNVILFWRLIARYLFGRAVIEIGTDGLYVTTNFPRGKHLKLLDLHQFSEVILKFYPEFGHMGYCRGGLAFLPWSYGMDVALMLGYYRLESLYFKPLFGEKEIHFLLKNKTAGDLVVLDTNRPLEFVDALEKTVRSSLNNSFKVTIESKPTFTVRYLPKILYFVVSVLLIVLISFLSTYIFRN